MGGVPMRVAGDIIQGRYRVVRSLGEGAFAQVYQGVDLTLGRDVAIKLMRLSILDHPGAQGEALRQDLMERFHREAMLVAKLRAEPTVTLFDFGAEVNGDMFMVLEYVAGRTLRQEVTERGRVSAARVAPILRQALRSLHEAHAYDLLHRDIKPENLMVFDYLGESDKLRLLDFGIAKALQERASVATASGLLMGTPRYIPPERVMTNTLFPASDLYSLGAVAYYLLTGQELYPDVEGAMMILQQQVSPEPVQLPESAGVPVGLARVVNKMLQKDLALRYVTAAEVEHDLAAYEFYTANMRYNVSRELPSVQVQPLKAFDDPLMTETPFMDDDEVDDDDTPLERGVAPRAPFERVDPSFGASPAPAPLSFGASPVTSRDDAPTEVVEVDPDMFE